MVNTYFFTIHKRATSEADQLRADGITVIGVGVGLTTTDELFLIVGKNAANMYISQDFNSLVADVGKIISTTCPNTPGK